MEDIILISLPVNLALRKASVPILVAPLFCVNGSACLQSRTLDWRRGRVTITPSPIHSLSCYNLILGGIVGRREKPATKVGNETSMKSLNGDR